MNESSTLRTSSRILFLALGTIFHVTLHALEISEQKTPRDQLLEISRHIKESELTLLHLDRRMRQIQDLEEERKNNLMEEQKHLGHVLGTLQRMEHASTPILLAKASDILESRHRSIMLASVVPSLKHKMETARKSVASIMALRTELEVLKQETTTTQTQLTEKQKSLEKLLDQTPKNVPLPLDSAQDIQHLQTLATQSETLTDFIEAITPHDSQVTRNIGKSQGAPASLHGNPSVPFIHNKGKLPLPAVGTLVRAYGEPDGYGSASKGLSIATQPQTLVTAPVDGRILFSGPFRSFQQLLIIDAGHGYHIVLAGMYKVMVSPGQFVLSGEPIALMGNVHEQSAVPLTGGAGMPVCYMEIRRGSIPIDPGPWLDQKTITQITQ